MDFHSLMISEYAVPFMITVSSNLGKLSIMKFGDNTIDFILSSAAVNR